MQLTAYDQKYGQFCLDFVYLIVLFPASKSSKI